MSRFNRFFAFVVIVTAMAGCARSAKMNVTIKDAPSSEIIVKQLNVNVMETLDTVSVDKSGNFSYRVAVSKGQPEFVYLYYKNRKIASMVLQGGDKVSVVTDTLGHYSVEGSSESDMLSRVEREYASALSRMNAIAGKLDHAANVNQAIEIRKELADEYVSYYRDRVKFVMENCFSISVVPVFYQTLGENLPLFSQTTDAIHFRNAADSLEKVYPDSRYVKVLRNEADRRMGRLEMESLMNAAQQISYPDIELPDINGVKRKLSEVGSKVVIINFWTATSPEQNRFNMDVLKPLYEDYHSRGLEVYQVSLDVDKRLWAQTVKQQVHPWVSVCDSRGTSSPYAVTYNLQILPSMFIIADGVLVDGEVVDEASLKKLVNKLLK